MNSISYLSIGRASELKGSDRALYRLFEILPGALSWGTLVGVAFFSWYKPAGVALFIIAFDVYWLSKTVYLSLHLRASWKRMKHHMKIEWDEKLENLKWESIWQLVILPMHDEPYEVVEEACKSLSSTSWPKDRMIVVLATEERAGREAEITAAKIKEKYGGNFSNFVITVHPSDVEGEIKGKGSNIAYSAREVVKILDSKGINKDHILVSAFDIDTQVYPQYFMCLTYHFLTAEFPHKSSYQPVPLYNNNIYDAHAFSRVVATSGTFWQMMQQVRPERLTTFSSHSMSLRALIEVNYWQTNIVSEDSRIFWKNLLHYNADYRVVPLFYPISMDANIAPTLWGTIKNVYMQQRRWTWGVENIPYILFAFVKNKSIPLRKRIKYAAVQLEGFWSLTTNPILIFLLGWLPLMLGGNEFNAMLIAYSLPRVTRILMSLAMLGLVGSAIISAKLLPPKPAHIKKKLYGSLTLQWLLIPITIIFFGSIPGLDAQTRLMFGRYMGFWVTPKHRKKIN